MVKFITALFIVLCVYTAWCQSDSKEPLGLALENFSYLFPVHHFKLHIQGQDVVMAYMDIKPVAKANDKTVLLLHGKNFFGAYWERTIRFLAGQGYRVIVPDQIGFGKSSKPFIVYSFQLLAEQTKHLLDYLSISTVAVVGHSMGGMLATRFTLMYPGMVSHLILENPIGLEDYKVKVPIALLRKSMKRNLKRQRRVYANTTKLIMWFGNLNTNYTFKFNTDGH